MVGMENQGMVYTVELDNRLLGICPHQYNNQFTRLGMVYTVSQLLTSRLVNWRYSEKISPKRIPNSQKQEQLTNTQ